MLLLLPVSGEMAYDADEFRQSEAPELRERWIWWMDLDLVMLDEPKIFLLFSFSFSFSPFLFSFLLCLSFLFPTILLSVAFDCKFVKYLRSFFSILAN